MHQKFLMAKILSPKTETEERGGVGWGRGDKSHSLSCGTCVDACKNRFELEKERKEAEKDHALVELKMINLQYQKLQSLDSN